MMEVDCIDENLANTAPVKPVVNLLWMKMAIAVAVIRSKPPGKSGKEHAINLRAKYFSAQAKFHKRLDSAKVIPESNRMDINVAAGNTMITPSSWQDVDAGLTDFPNPQDCLGGTQMSIENTKFSRSLIALQNLTTRNFLSDPAAMHYEAISHLRCLHDVLEQGLVCLSERCLSQAAHTIAVVMATLEETEEQQQHRERPGFMQEVCSFVELIISMLALQPTDQGQYPPHRQKHSLVRMLLIFTQQGSQALALSIVDQLTESLEVFTTSLRDSQTSGKLLDPVCFENSYFIVQCLELTLGLWQRDCPAHPNHLQELQTRLDTCLIGITGKFHLIAQAVWKVTSLIEGILQNKWS